jgi:hypothetical protein
LIRKSTAVIFSWETSSKFPFCVWEAILVAQGWKCGRDTYDS